MELETREQAIARAEELLQLLQLEAVEQDLFLGQNEARRGRRLFGGQVLSQSLRAAAHTVADANQRPPHSLHGYFMRAGDAERRVLYEVERIRDGKSFTTRRVVAIQNGEAIFNLDVSFHGAEKGLEHADSVPNVPVPEELEDDREIMQRLLEDGVDHPRLTQFTARARPFEIRAVFPAGEKSWGIDRRWNPVWVRFLAPVDADDQILARCLLAYASDVGLVNTSTLPHQSTQPVGEFQTASLDHALWIHRDVDVSDWLLFHKSTTWADSARGLSSASFFSRDGTLIASVTQEGLLRPPRDAS